jgi:hypothetical protein
VVGPAQIIVCAHRRQAKKNIATQHAMSMRRDSALRIAIHTQGGGQHETDKELGNAFIGYLAHRLGLGAINPGSQWPEPDLGDPRHCGGCFDPAGSVGFGFSALARG